jgi:hypothetical protein
MGVLFSLAILAEWLQAAVIEKNFGADPKKSLPTNSHRFAQMEKPVVEPRRTQRHGETKSR